MSPTVVLLLIGILLKNICPISMEEYNLPQIGENDSTVQYGQYL